MREPYEFYPTPPEGTLALLAVERFDGPIWEPACGDGAMAKVLVRAGYAVVATDLIDRGYGTGGIDFLKETKARARHIVTNPPYGFGLADAFVNHALQLVEPERGSVAMLLNLAGLANPRRTWMYVSRPPANVYVLDELTCYPGGRFQPSPRTHRYCWCVWRPDHVGRPALWWLSTAPFRRASSRT